ncbi:MAG TPA: alpha-amylase/4-alpha-glucanotransferase domain-containing protein [Candidatus Acidoferrales bacterium]|nr:alpha-amylase/4-alpha-glucanotransferase domain-containing protein [Candidatus Acidoferrales bacterium]
MPQFELVLLIHAHQPVGNFDEVLERAYRKSYRPFIDVLARHPSIRAGLHYSGPLLEWLETRHPDYFGQLRELVARQQVEMVGGGFYEPILVTIPPEDRHEQITRLSDYVEKHFGARPRGAWIAERVWEPQIPSCLAPAGVQYTLVDDNHFLSAGFNLDDLYGYRLTEDLGHTVKVLAGLKILRYLIPFHDVTETIDFLRKAAAERPRGFATMGDDLEKFGIWPGTNDLCYREGWLEHFFSAIEQSASWLGTSTPSDAIATHDPLGRADLPSASYTEMMEWSLPSSARDRYHKLIEEFSSRPDVLPFLRGGAWRSFLTKYSESNLMHKKMLHVSDKVQRLSHHPRRDKYFRQAHDEATTLLLRGQCNDSYWHGIFGGLYAPHLRTAVWTALARAESIADSLAHRKKQFAQETRLDFDADGREEFYFTSDRYAALVVPDDGATICALDFRPANVTLVNSLMRRLESYHAKLRHLSEDRSAAVHSIHEQARAKEEGLQRWLVYDRWPRNAFRLLLFGMGKTQQDYMSCQLGEDAALAGGHYRVANSSATQVSLVCDHSRDWPLEKIFSFAPTSAGFDIACQLTLRRDAPGTASVHLGLEIVLNLLAPSSPDRYFESDGKRFPLRWSAAVPGQQLRVIDQWQRVSVALEAPAARCFWIAPIETISESEDGFERIYQGSQILAVWPVELSQGGEWRGQLTLHAGALRPDHV